MHYSNINVFDQIWCYPPLSAYDNLKKSQLMDIKKLHKTVINLLYIWWGKLHIWWGKKEEPQNLLQNMMIDDLGLFCGWWWSRGFGEAWQHHEFQYVTGYLSPKSGWLGCRWIFHTIMTAEIHQTTTPTKSVLCGDDLSLQVWK